MQGNKTKKKKVERKRFNNSIYVSVSDFAVKLDFPLLKKNK